MSTKVQPISGMEDTIQNALTSTASSTVSPKVSLFTKKSGFVIPKNKLSGSLVPIFRGSTKPGGTDVENEESTKPVLRKTKWGPDLTQDAFVRKGRASAYQTRLDQITQQLKSGIMEARDDHDSPLAHGAAQESADRRNIEKSELLELERREVIGEILKLNPSYKAPAYYKPLLKEAKVAIPIKEYPGRNFVGIIFGPAGDTQKRLEKETGAKIRVYGTKADTRKEIEITSSDGNEAYSVCEEMSVLVTAETYEKVDAAVSLIELLVTPILANAAPVPTKDAGSGDDQNAVSLGQDASSSYSISPMLVNQGVAQPFTGSGPAPASAQFQPYPSQWLPTGQSSGFIAPPFPKFSAPMLSNPMQVSSSLSNSAAMPPSFGPQPVMSGAFGSVPNHPSHLPSQPQFQVPNIGYAGPPRNPSLPQLQSAPGQPNFSAPPGPNQNMRPMRSPIPRSAPPYTFPERPLTSAGWSQPPAGTLGPNMPQMMQPMVRPRASFVVASQPSDISGGEPSPFRPPAILPQVAPPPAVGPQTGAPNPAPSSWFPSSTTSTSIPLPSIRPPPPITAVRPQQPSSNDFTFQTHHAQSPSSQQVPRPGSQPRSQFMPPRNPQVHPPQPPLFRPGMNNHGAPPIMQGFHRPQNSQQMGQHQGPSNMPPPPDRQPVFPGHGPRAPTIRVPQMGPRQFGPGSPAIPFPPRPGNFGQVPQNHPSMGFRPQNLMGPSNPQFRGNVPHSLGRPASGPQHIYDPFSPTAVPHKPVNPQNSRKQDSDPEYDDLMASVGVK